MSVESVGVVERSVHKTNEWLLELAGELGEDREEAWRILKAFLQVLRDELHLSRISRGEQLVYPLRYSSRRRRLTSCW
jgi:hypothetical protein